MRIRLNLRWLLVPALFFSLQLCRANDLTFGFGVTNDAPLWDLSGLYSLTLNVKEPNGDVIPVTVTFNMRQDAAGNLHGFANDFQELDIDQNSFFTVTYTISGNVRGSSQGPIAHFVVHFVGHGSSSGQPDGPFSATLLVDAGVDSETLALDPIKPIRFIARLPRASVHGFVPLTSETTIPLPPGEDGSWSLNLQFDTFNRAIGTATITTPNKSLGFNLSGALTGTAEIPSYNLKISGARDVANTVSGVGSKATVVLSTTTNTLDTIGISGKIMGQKLFVPATIF